MNILNFVVAQKLAIAQDATSSQATSDALLAALIRSPMGLIMALIMARNQGQQNLLASAAAAKAQGT